MVDSPQRFELTRRESRSFVEALAELAQRELKRTCVFVVPGLVRIVVQKRKARII